MKSALIKTAVLGLFAAASVPSFATCTGADCDSSSVTTVKFDSSYYLSPNAKGVILQANTGNRIATVDLNNVIMRGNGDIEAAATAVGNTVSIELEGLKSDVAVRHVNQNNRGDQYANVDLFQSGSSVTGEVKLSAQAIGNSFSIDTKNSSTSLSELSIAQCNVGSGAANVVFLNDPTKLTATATAVGNAVSIVRK